MATDAISNDLVTEDDTPVDNFFSEKQQRLLTEPLYSSRTDWGGKRSFIAASNVGLFFAIRSPPLVPDALLSMDVELPADLQPKSHRSYFVWEYGKPPDVVIEVVSNREGGEDTQKLAAYARVRVPYYAVFDHEKLLSAEVLRGYRLDGTEYYKMDEQLWFPGIGLGLRIWQGRFEEHENTWLRWVDANGEPVPTGQERAERLAEQLRQLGVEPVG